MAAPAERIPATEIDRGRLERIFNAHHASVWRALRRRGLSAEAAEDATQETFLLAADRLEDIRPESERAFLIATAVRVAHIARPQDRALGAGRRHGSAPLR